MDVVDWLLEGDPSIRWQVREDLLDAPPDEVAAERARVATEGWGARLLALRDDDGQWAGGACFPREVSLAWQAGREPDFSGGQPWTSTLPTLDLLRRLGLDPTCDAARETLALVTEHCRWEHDGQAFFDGEVEACINGRTLAIGAWWGADVDALASRLLADQLGDGGWNCWTEHGSTVASFHSTTCVLEGLAAYERSGGAVPVGQAVRRGEDYLLERRLFRRLGTGEVVDEDWLRASWPPQWHHDVLRGLEHFALAGGPVDERLGEAVTVLREQQQQPDGTWLLDHVHPGESWFDLEPVGRPSRWNTLRALRVLRWVDG